MGARRQREDGAGGLPHHQGDSVKLLPVDPPPATTVDRVIEVVPEVVEKVTDFLEKQKKADESPEGTDHFVV